MTANLRKIIVIAGPTAVGKSAAAIRIAKQLKSEIVSLDSVQIYKHFNVGSAKVNLKDRQDIPHHLIDLLEPQEEMNAAKFTTLADRSINEISDLGKIPIVVGGSNLYLKSLLHGLSEAPTVSADLRVELQKLNLVQLYDKLKVLDPQRAAELHPNDKVRILRSLEIIDSTGKTIAEINAQHEFSNIRYQALLFVLVADRQTLIERIKIRSSKMLADGLIEETESIIRKYGRNLPALKSIGYAQSLDYIDGKIKSKDLADTIVQATRRYAKQQMTFWKNEPPKRGWNLISGIENVTTSIDLNSADGDSNFIVKALSFRDISAESIADLWQEVEMISFMYCD